MAPETIDDITSSGDVNRGDGQGSTNPTPSRDESGEGTSNGTRARRSSEPPETLDSDIGKRP